MYEMHRKAIEKLYTKKCDIAFGHVVKDPDSRENTRTLMTKYADIPCHLSLNKPSSRDIDSEGINTLKATYKLFIPPEVSIAHGDIVIIDGVNYKAGKSHNYVSHQVATLIEEEKA